MERIVNQHFTGRSVTVDQKHFVGCTMTDCILEYSGQPFTLESTQLTGCRYVFFGFARGTVHFLQSVGLLPSLSEDWRELPEQIH
jgi:hypothetical protein